MIFIDDRPCSRLRPCSFNNALLQRGDIIPILIRFKGQEHCEDYSLQTQKNYVYTVQQEDNIIEEANSFRSWCKSYNLTPDTFCCMSEPKQIFGQAFARELGLNGLSPEISLALRHKPTMKKWLQLAGFKTALFSTVSSPEEIRSFANVHGYPIVIKPTTGWGTLDTFLLKAPDEVEDCITSTEAFDEMMVETFIGFREYECCALIQDGYVIDVYPSYMPSSPLTAANGGINANISYGHLKNSFPIDLKHLVRRIVEEFRLKNGYLHMEFFMNDESQEVIISELALRYPGCEIAKNHGLSLGFDIANTTIDIYLGKPVQFEYKLNRCVGDLLLPYRPGVVKHVSTSSELSDLPGVIECHLGVVSGQYLPVEHKSSFNCSGWVFVEGKDIHEVEKRMYNVLDNFSLVTQ